MARLFSLAALTLIVFFTLPTLSHAANDVWDTASSGLWSTNANWLDNTTPGNADTATFNLAGAYTATFISNPAAIQALTVTGPNLTLASSSGPRTLNVNSATGGQDVIVNGSATLTLGTAAGPVHLTVGDDLTVNGGSTLQVNSGSQVNTVDLIVAQSGGNGTIVVDGAGSQLNASTSSVNMATNGLAASLTYRNSAQGSLAAGGTVTVTQSNVAASSAVLNIESDADVDVGNLNIGTASTAASTGTVNVNGAGSTLDMLGASTLTVGGAAGIGVLNVGVASTGATVNTGTGLTTISPNGTVTLGGFGRVGTINFNGDVLVNGGVLQEGLNIGNDINVAAGRTLTIAGGGRVTLRRDSFSDANAICNITGVGSTLEILDGEFMGIATAGQFFPSSGQEINVSAGGLLSVQNNMLARTASISVDGSGSAAVFGGVNATSFGGGLGGETTNMEVTNAASVSFASGLTMASADMSTATLFIESGGDVSMGGNLRLATAFSATNPSATISVQGAGSTLTLSGGGNIRVGENSGAAAINIGTTTSGGAFTTGAGPMVINAAGTVTVGSAATTGTLNVNGDLTVDGGVLQRLNAGSSLVLAPGKTLTVQNGGTATFSHGSGNNYTTANNAVYNINGVDSTWEFVGGSGLNIHSGATVNVGAGGLLSTTGNLAVGSVISAGGTLSIQGAGANATVGDASSLTVGHANAGSGVINIGTTTSGGTLTTGTGLLTINATGTVNVGAVGGSNSGTLNANGNVTLNGGDLLRNSASTFALAAGKTMTIQNGGLASFTGSYSTANAVYNISGVNSQLLATTNINIGNGAQVNVSVGGALAAAGALDVGTLGNGTLSVDGAGSTADSNEIFNDTFWGRFGHAANITFSNSGAGRVDGALKLAGSDNAGTSATVNVLSGAQLSVVGDLSLASLGGATTTATLNINGVGSALTLGSLFGSPKDLTVGHSATGAAAINIGTTANGGTLNADDGDFTIHRTGVVTIGSGANVGALVANGDVLIDGGVLQMGTGSTFVLAAGKTMTVQNGGRATVNGAVFNQFSTAANAVYNITGAGSRLETTTTSLGVRILEGAQMNISAGGVVSSTGDISIGSFGVGTLTVDGSGSSALTTNPASISNWGSFGDIANVTFRNNATGSFGALNLANDDDAGTTTVVNVESGADLSISGNLLVAAVGGATTSATLTVRGAGSTATVGPGALVTLGHASTGAAVVNVLDDAVFTVSNSLVLRPTAQLNINGGTAHLGTLADQGGVINFTAGELSYLGDLIVGTGGLLGNNLILNADRRLSLSGTTTIDAGRELTLAGGTLNTGTLVVNGTFNFIAGTLGITQAGAAINAPIVTANPSTIYIGANNVALGSASSFNGFNHQGVLNVGANSLTLNSAGYAQLGVLTSLGGGTISAPNGVTLDSGSNLLGHGTVNARVAAELGSVIEADGPLAIGQGSSPAGFSTNGELRTNQHAVTINSSSQAALGNLTTLGSGSSPGTLNAANGLIVDFGHALTGFGTVNSTNSLQQRTVINGIAQGNSIAQPLTLTGYIKGVGVFNNVTFTGQLDPGLSPTILTVGNIALSPTSTLIMELAGTSPGSGYDQIQASGALALNGALQVSLLDGFTPAAGNSFNLFDWASSTGTFSSLLLPALPGALAWDISQLYATGVLSISAPAFTADFDLDGDVDGDDLDLWTASFGVNDNADADNDGDSDGADFLAWQGQIGFGSSAQSRSRSSDAASSGFIPEPNAFCLGLWIFAGAAVRGATRRR
jgi:hypothetical protein